MQLKSMVRSSVISATKSNSFGLCLKMNRKLELKTRKARQETNLLLRGPDLARPLFFESIIVYKQVSSVHLPVLFFEHCSVLVSFFKQQTALGKFLRMSAELLDLFCRSGVVFCFWLIFEVDVKQNVNTGSLTVKNDISGAFVCNDQDLVWEGELDQGSLVFFARQVALKHAVSVDTIQQVLVCHDYKRVTNLCLPAFSWID